MSLPCEVVVELSKLGYFYAPMRPVPIAYDWEEFEEEREGGDELEDGVNVMGGAPHDDSDHEDSGGPDSTMEDE